MKNLKMENMTGQTDEEKYQQLTNIDQRAQSDEISLKAISELFDMKKLKTISRVKFEQVSVNKVIHVFRNVWRNIFEKISR